MLIWRNVDKEYLEIMQNSEMIKKVLLIMIKGLYFGGYIKMKYKKEFLKRKGVSVSEKVSI